MECIKEGVSKYKRILREQPYNEKATYRQMYYTIKKETDNGVLLFSTVTKEMVLLASEEAQAFINEPKEAGKDDRTTEQLEQTRQFLVKNWFLVPEDFDERNMVDQFRELIQLFERNGSQKLKSVLIGTTTGCNARCFYCFEKGMVHRVMDEKTAEDIAGFLKDNGDEKGIEINWFGGEPLFNDKVIDIITERLAEMGVPFSSRMISNGYLFDEEMTGKAKEKWNLKNVQITLDGTEDVYNKAKNYIYTNADSSPFQVVLENIERLQAEGICVKIRLNVDLYNIEDMFLLTDVLADRFVNKKKLYVYTNPLYGEANNERNEEQRNRLYAQMERLEAYIEEKGFRRLPVMSNSIRMNSCMVDNDNATVITPDGHLSKCEYDMVDNYYGSIYDDRKAWNLKIIENWKRTYAPTEQCRTCAKYPDCRMNIQCPTGEYKKVIRDGKESIECYDCVIQKWISDIQKDMVQLYQRYLRQKQST